MLALEGMLDALRLFAAWEWTAARDCIGQSIL